MADDSTTGPRLEGDDAALAFVLQVFAGSVALIAMRAIIHQQLAGEILGNVAAWMAMFPFVRRTWVSGVPFRHYLRMVVLVVTLGTTFRILTI